MKNMAIDLHSTTSVLGAHDEEGELLCCWRFATTGTELVDHLQAVKADEVHLVIEETAMTRWALELLRAYCVRALSCDPKHNRLVARSGPLG